MHISCTAPAFIRQALGDTAEPRLCVQSDLMPDGRLGPAWLALGEGELVAGHAEQVTVHLQLDRIDSVEVEELYGRGRLMAKLKPDDESGADDQEGDRPAAEEHQLITYTADLIAEFACVARAVSEALRGKEPLLPATIEVVRDPDTGLPLQERGAPMPRGRNRRATIMRVLGLLRPHKRLVVTLILLTFVSVGAQMIMPVCFKEITDTVIAESKHDQLMLWVGIMIAAFLVVGVARYGANLINAWMSNQLVGHLRSAVHTKMQHLRMSYHNDHESGELIGRVSHDTQTLLHFLIDGFPWMLVNLVSLVTIATILVLLDPFLTLFVLLPVPLITLGGKFFFTRLVTLGHRIGNRQARMHSQLSESIRGVKAVKAATQEQRRSRDFDQVNDDLVTTIFRTERSWLSFQESTAIAMAAGVIAIWWVGTYQVIGERGMTLGTLIAFVSYITLFYGPLQWFTFVLNWMGRATAGAERVFQVLDQPTEVDVAQGDKPLSAVTGDIVFEDVRFSYERGKEVLKGIDLRFPAGTLTGLVGKSGSGKSTIINLVCRFFEPDSGRILVDGEALAEVRLADWRRHIGIVLQDPFLFNASIADNIRYGCPEADFAEVVRAARAAHAHDFIVNKEDGYDSVVGEGGITLSGGEKQRVAIARAILADPKILILDEATSAVDSETEQAIQSAIDKLVEGRTTIAIAHRLATLRNADQLVVIDDGTIAEQGSHAELLANEQGTFTKLVRAQQEINELRGEQVAYKE